MIEKRIFNLRAYELAAKYAQKNHTKIYALIRVKDEVYAVKLDNASYLEQLPQFYTEWVFFWFRSLKTLIKRYNNKIIFVSLPDFLAILNDSEENT